MRVDLEHARYVVWLVCFGCAAERLVGEHDEPECPNCGSADVHVELVPVEDR